MEKLFWVDLEMTGLDVEREVIIEVAAIVTDLDMNEIDTYECVVKQPQKYIDAMDEWNTKHHTDSGLVAKIPSGKDPETVENELIAMIDKHFDSETRPVLAGNSISQDRKFIDRYMKRLSDRLHYRLLDVTGWKVIFENIYKKKFEKKDAHRALDDIRESIGELKYYMEFIQPS